MESSPFSTSLTTFGTLNSSSILSEVTEVNCNWFHATTAHFWPPFSLQGRLKGKHRLKPTHMKLVIAIPGREMENGNRGREIKIPAQNGKRREIVHLLTVYLLIFSRITYMT